MRSMVWAAALTLLVALGCEKKEAPAATAPEAAPATTAAVPVPAPLPAAAAEPVVEVDSLPVEEQYEAEAEQEITASNLTTKIDELEKELRAP